MAVVAQGLRDVAEREPGDVDAERLGLVEPERRPGGEAQDQTGDEGHHQSTARRAPAPPARIDLRGAWAVAGRLSSECGPRPRAEPPSPPSDSAVHGRDATGVTRTTQAPPYGRTR